MPKCKKNASRQRKSAPMNHGKKPMKPMMDKDDMASRMVIQKERKW